MAIHTADKIFLDINDEINFVVEKILYTDKERVIVVVPQNAIVVSSLVSMKILAKQIAKSKKALVLVTEDEFGLQIAEQAGVVAVTKVSSITPETWEQAQILKTKFLDMMEQTRRELLGERGVEVSDLRRVSKDDEVKETEAAEELKVDEQLEADPEVAVLPEIEKSAEVEDDTPEDTESEQEEGEEEPAIEEEEKIVGPIQRKRREPKLVQFGSISLLAGGDVGLYEEEDKDANIGPDSETEVEDIEPAPTRIKRPEFGGERKAKGFTGRDWTKYTKEPGQQFSLASLWPFSKNNSERLTDAESTRRAKKRKMMMIAGFVAAMLLIFGGGYVMAFQLSSVEVRLSLKTAEVPVDQQVVADTEVEEVDETDLVIPATILTNDQLSLSASGTSTGEGKRGNKASGLIEIWNKTSSEVTLPAGTVLENTTTNLKYVLKEQVVLEAAEADPNNPDLIKQYGGVTEEHSVEAESFGEEYNIVEAGTKSDFKVAGYTTEQLLGKRFRPIEGGDSESFLAVSQEDFDTLKDTLVEKLEEEGREKLTELLPAGFRLIEGSEVFTEKESSSVPAVGEEAAGFSLSVEGEISALIIDEEDLRTAIEIIISRKQELGGEFEVDDLSDVVIADVERTEGRATFKVTSQGSLRSKVTEDEIKSAIAGMTIDDAEEYLAGLDEVEGFRISFTPQLVPGWLRRIPSVAGRIKIVTE